jgi:hypothetical protein
LFVLGKGIMKAWFCPTRWFLESTGPDKDGSIVKVSVNSQLHI